MLRHWLKTRPARRDEARHNPQAEARLGEHLRLLSFNIQVGISTRRYHHYLTRSWQHLLPHRERAANLQQIAALLGDFDLVALQEVDGGSLRSGYINQVEHLAQLAGFPWWYQQLNRNLGPFAQHSNGLLSRLQPQQLEDHPLPGPRGRGAIFARFGQGHDALLVVVMHLALGARTRARQLAYIRERLEDHRHCVLMGDMNTHATELLEHSPLRDLGLIAPQACATYPSWQPQRCIDHILLSPELTLERMQVIDLPVSDHLPVAVDIRLPGALQPPLPLCSP
ncbi:endonuclease/exonuclease/phosphatase family protein [Pseudomonas sp. NW5]|uniref:endonuclease/exonuclease/phosphatase family protein n=1 Tax=Pseudomonas sp. NW5 TaxID=2934934 RepID=UPI0020214798|nr:endonuclease/exonuclease/phosphatase family protein [Pseudomonas sp. NW5]MCL7461351.1 endonuclease/exonuclease/phosphatase family protein [Pseudomonas sp. NW5]